MDVVYQLHVHDVFSTISTECFLNWTAFSFLKLPNVFDNVFDVFGIYGDRFTLKLFFACRRCLFTTE